MALYIYYLLRNVPLQIVVLVLISPGLGFWSVLGRSPVKTDKVQELYCFLWSKYPFLILCEKYQLSVKENICACCLLLLLFNPKSAHLSFKTSLRWRWLVGLQLAILPLTRTFFVFKSEDLSCTLNFVEGNQPLKILSIVHCTCRGSDWA